MKVVPIFGAVLAFVIMPAPALADAAFEPPMDDFNNAFYQCNEPGAFLVSYDSDKPTSATITTANNNKNYSLQRTSSESGVLFSGGAVKFWTDGKTTTLTGTETTYKNCALKKHG